MCHPIPFAPMHISFILDDTNPIHPLESYAHACVHWPHAHMLILMLIIPDDPPPYPNGVPQEQNKSPSLLLSELHG
jgi:hypothetical protein